jgi:hypothetical protein
VRTPKESFLISSSAAEFKKMLASTAFEVACDYALMELQHQMPPNCTPSLPTDPYIGIDANAQMWGAKRVIEILQNLTEPPKKPETPRRESLHY